MNERLNNACQALKAATDEFIEAHAEYARGHRPVLWATFYQWDKVIIVGHQSWIGLIENHFHLKHEPVEVIEWPEPDRNP